MRHAYIAGKEIFDRIRKRFAFRAVVDLYRLDKRTECNEIVIIVLHYSDFGEISVFYFASVS